MFNEYRGFLCNPLRCSQMTLLPFLLFEQGLTDNFPKRSFRFLNDPMGIFPRIEITYFGGVSTDYGVKSSEGIFWGGVYIKGKEDNANPLQKKSSFSEISVLIHGGSVCSFLGQPRG